MESTTVKLSREGEVPLPRQFRDCDSLRPSDEFRFQRLGSGRYLLQKIVPPPLAKAELVRSENGFLVFRAPKNAPRITTELVKRLEADTG